jgi:hypothetical protein
MKRAMKRNSGGTRMENKICKVLELTWIFFTSGALLQASQTQYNSFTSSHGKLLYLHSSGS